MLKTLARLLVNLGFKRRSAPYDTTTANHLSYKTKFDAALEFTERIGCERPYVTWQSESILAHQDSSAVEEALRMAGIKDLSYSAAQCLKWSAYMRPLLQKTMRTPVFLTIGQIWKGTTPVFHPSWEQLERWIKEGLSFDDFEKSGSGLNFHAWLTLQSGEILDISYMSSLAATNPKGWGKYAGHVLGGYPEEVFQSHSYHPMVIGDDYADKLSRKSPAPLLAKTLDELYEFPVFAVPR